MTYVRAVIAMTVCVLDSYLSKWDVSYICASVKISADKHVTLQQQSFLYVESMFCKFKHFTDMIVLHVE